MPGDEAEERDFKNQFGSLPAPKPGLGEPEPEAEDFKTPFPGTYYGIIQHQHSAGEWPHRDDFKSLREWGFAFVRAFELRTKDADLMAMPLIRIERLNIRTLGKYDPDPDGYALSGIIALNGKRLGYLPHFLRLVLLMMMLLQAWQHQRGGDGRLDRECRGRMKAMGLSLSKNDRRVKVARDGRFRELLTEAGIAVPPEAEWPEPEPDAERTTLRLFSCTCQKARIGKKVFLAVCTNCGQPFLPGNNLGPRSV